MAYNRSRSCLITRCALGIGAAVLCIGGLFVPVASFFHRPSDEASSLLEAVTGEEYKDPDPDRAGEFITVKSIAGPLSDSEEPPHAKPGAEPGVLKYAGQMSSTLFPSSVSRGTDKEVPNPLLTIPHAHTAIGAFIRKLPESSPKSRLKDLLTAFSPTTSTVKIGDLIKAIVLEEQKGSLPVPEFVKLVPLLEEVNKRLLEAVTAEEDNNINLDKFGEFVLSAHMDVAPPEVAPPEDEVMVITAVQKWAWEVWKICAFPFSYFEPEYVEVSEGYQMYKALSATVEAKFWMLENKVTRKMGKAAMGSPSGWFTNENGAKDYVFDPWGQNKGFNRVQSFTPKAGPTAPVKLFNLMNIENLALLTTTILATAVGGNVEAEDDLKVVQVTTGFGASWADQLSLASEGRPDLASWAVSDAPLDLSMPEDLKKYLYNRDRCDDVTQMRAHDSFCSPAMRHKLDVTLPAGSPLNGLKFDTRTGLILSTPSPSPPGWPGDADPLQDPHNKHRQIVAFQVGLTDSPWIPFKILKQDPKKTFWKPKKTFWKSNFDILKGLMDQEDEVEGSVEGENNIFSAAAVKASSGLKLKIAHAAEVQVFTGTDEEGCKNALHSLAKAGISTNLDLLKKHFESGGPAEQLIPGARLHFCTLWGPRKWDLNRWSLHSFDKELINIIAKYLPQYAGYYAAPAPTFKDELEPKQIEGMDRNGIPYYGRHFLLQEMALRHPHEILTMTGRLALSCGAEEPGLELMPRGAFAAQVVAGPISDGDLERSVGFDNLDDGKSLFDPEKVRLRHITRGYDVVGIPLTLIASGSLSEAMSKVSGLEERFRKEDIFVSEYAVIDSGFHLFKAMTWTGALGRNFQWLAEGKSGWFSDEANANAYVSSLFGHKTKYTGVKEFAPRRSLKLFHLMDNENLSLLTATILAQGRTPKALKDLEVVQVATGFGVTWPDQLKKAVDRKWIKSRDLMSFTRCEDLARFCTGVSDDAGSCHDGFVGLRQDGTADEGDLRRAIETETEEVKLITISGEEGTEKETIWGPRLHDLNRLSTQKSDAELAKVIEEYLGGNYQGYYAGDAPSLDLSLAGTWPAELARMGQVGMNFFPQEICLFSMADVRDVV